MVIPLLNSSRARDIFMRLCLKIQIHHARVMNLKVAPMNFKNYSMKVVNIQWKNGQVRWYSRLEKLPSRHDHHKDSDTAKHLYSNIGSKVDFLQLIKTLTNDKSVNVLQYNENLANIVANPTDTEVIQAQMLDDVRKLAEKTNDVFLLGKIQEFEKHLDDLRREKEGQDFTKQDQQRLADVLRNTKAKFILVIKNTPFIMSLYEEGFNILSFDNHYTYNVRSRNDRKTEHLIITNLPVWWQGDLLFLYYIP